MFFNMLYFLYNMLCIFICSITNEFSNIMFKKVSLISVYYIIHLLILICSHSCKQYNLCFFSVHGYYQSQVLKNLQDLCRL